MAYGLRFRDQLPPIVVEELDGLVASLTAVNEETVATPGPTGPQGSTGASAYDLAVLAGFTGTEDEFTVGLGGALTVTLTNAQVLALFGTPVTVVPAPGANKVIVPRQLLVSTNLTGAYAEAYSLQVYWAGDTTALVASVGNTLDTTTRKVVNHNAVSQAVNLTLGSNKALVISNETGAFTTGNAANSVRVTAIYNVIDV